MARTVDPWAFRSRAGIRTWGWLPDHAESDDRFGAALAVGDFDDDGFDDLAIGVPGEDSPAPDRIEDAGAVQVIYGTRDGLRSRKNQLLTQSWTGMQNAPHAFDRFGNGLTAKNFDANPGTDLAVSVPGEDLGPDYDAGAISVIFGSAVRGLSEAGNQLVHHSAMPIEVIAADAASSALDTVMRRVGEETSEAAFERPPSSPSEDYAQRSP